MRAWGIRRFRVPPMSDHHQVVELNSAGKSGGSPVSPPVVVVSPAGRQTVWWMLTVVLAVIATALVLRWDEARLVGSVYAQRAGVGGSPAGKQYIYAFSGQLTSKSYGLFMVDVDTGTLWCYEMQGSRTGQLQMKLVAARSWIFDRYLEEFNVAEPIPGAVRLMVQQQRSHREDAGVLSGETGGAKSPVLPEGEGEKN